MVVDAAAMVDPGAERALVRLVPFHVNLSPPNCPYCRAGRVTKRARPIDRGAANNLCPALSGAMTAVQHVNPVQSDAVGPPVRMGSRIGIGRRIRQVQIRRVTGTLADIASSAIHRSPLPHVQHSEDAAAASCIDPMPCTGMPITIGTEVSS